MEPETNTPLDVAWADGGAWAAVLATAIGCSSFGLLVDLVEASKRVKAAMTFYAPVGDLSGKSTVAVIVWLIAWATLHFRWRGRIQPHASVIGWTSIVLILASIVMTFPPFFDLLG